MHLNLILVNTREKNFTMTQFVIIERCYIFYTKVAIYRDYSTFI